MTKIKAFALFIILILIAIFLTLLLWFYMGEPSMNFNMKLTLPNTENNVFIVENSGFIGNNSQSEIFTQFKLTYFVLSGAIFCYKVDTNLIHWIPDGLNIAQTKNKTNSITLTQNGGYAIYSYQDISNFYVNFYFNNGELIKWSNWNYSISKF